MKSVENPLLDYEQGICNICGCEYTPKPDIPAPLCEECWEEHRLDRDEPDELPVACDMCGELYIPEPDDLMPFCSSCQEEQCR